MCSVDDDITLEKKQIINLPLRELRKMKKEDERAGRTRHAKFIEELIKEKLSRKK